jgi:long-chain acyl-CoA synthetase
VATTRFRSVAELFLHRIAATPDREAFLVPSGSAWNRLSWRDVGDRVRAIACGLRALGLEDEQRCAILSTTRIEWLLIDLGVLCGGGATTTIYPSNTPDECAFIIQDSESNFAFAENDAQVAKLSAKRAELPSVRHVITIDGKPSDDGWVLRLDALEERGRAWDSEHPGRFEEIARAVAPTSLATLVYTSGTTGQPKGVELTHDCWVYEAEGIDALGLLHADDVQYLWLPMSHVFGKVLEAAQLQIGFSTAVDGRIDKLVENLGAVRPTFSAAVPRIFEKVHNKIVTGAREGGAVKLAIFRWALAVGRRVSALAQQGQSPGPLLALEQAVAERLVFAKLKKLFGGRLRFFVSGSAPLARDLTEFFHAAGVLVLEGYGLTESSAATFVNRPDRYRFGSVGLALPGSEVRIAPEDGEILLRGRGVMRGYHNRPDATREALDDEGWLHTGDIGELDRDGFLRITDRKKDLIKTSGGKYVAPQALEGKLKANCPYLSQVLVHGNNRNFCSALVTLDEEAVRKWARESGVGDRSVAEYAADPRVHALIKGYVDQVNAGLASYETVKKFAILPADLTEASGELTASLKVKRKVVEKKYQAILDGFYAGAVEAA